MKQLIWFREGEAVYQLIPGAEWMIRWRKANGEPSEWMRLSAFLRSRVVRREIIDMIHRQAEIFGYE